VKRGVNYAEKTGFGKPLIRGFFPHGVFLGFQFLGQRGEVAAELGAELVSVSSVAPGLGFLDFAGEESFALGDFGLVARAKVSEFLFLRDGQFNEGFTVSEAFHSEFVSGFHADI
jgi:hypothetical protein